VDWDLRLLAALRSSRPAWDEPPDWRAALTLYEGLPPEDAADLDRAVAAMIDEDYRNPHSCAENLPFDDVMVNLPAGMTPDDLMCVEAAALVATERGLGSAFFAVGRLLRSPRWHALHPRLHWLSYAALDVQRKLGLTRAGRIQGALVGAAVSDGLSMNEGDLAVGPWGDPMAAMLHVAGILVQTPKDPGPGFSPWVTDPANGLGTGWLLLGAGAIAAAVGPDPGPALAMVSLVDRRPGAAQAVLAFQATVAAALTGRSKSDALMAGLATAPDLRTRLGRIERLEQADLVPDGDLVDILVAALWYFLRGESFEMCVRGAAMHPDARRACGVLAGAFYGPSAVPRRWSTVLRQRAILEEAAQRLYTVSESASH